MYSTWLASSDCWRPQFQLIREKNTEKIKIKQKAEMGEKVFECDRARVSSGAASIIVLALRLAYGSIVSFEFAEYNRSWPRAV